MSIFCVFCLKTKGTNAEAPFSDENIKAIQKQ